MKKKITYLIIFIASMINFQANSQSLENYENRLKAIKNQNIIFYDIDGISITSEIISSKFSEKKLKKIYKKYSLKRRDLKVKDSLLNYNNYHVVKEEELSENLYQKTSLYFIENKKGKITVVTFSAVNKQNSSFEREFINIIIENNIPNNVYQSLEIENLDFAGRKIKLGGDCHFLGVNNVQCPYNGQIDWSLHENLTSAQKTIENRFKVTKSKKGAKVIEEKIIDIKFEGIETKAKRIKYNMTGINSLLAGMSGGKTLTVFYVATELRGEFISCVLSQWNNDNKDEEGISPLLGEIIKLK